MTRRLNQDVLEHLFGQIRQIDRTYDHPCSLAFKQRIKRIVIVHKHECLTSVAPNTIFQEEGEKMVVSELQQLKSLIFPIKKEYRPS